MLFGYMCWVPIGWLWALEVQPGTGQAKTRSQEASI